MVVLHIDEQHPKLDIELELLPQYKANKLLNKSGLSHLFSQIGNIRQKYVHIALEKLKLEFFKFLLLVEWIEI